MQSIIKGTYKKEKDKSYYTQIEWNILYSESAGSFYTDTIPKLQQLAKENNVNENNIRIVFWFDN